jgi:membrane protease YdiL (CAAX protease family)
VRGFLMTEVAALAGMPAAVVASTLVQTSYHLYQGVPNAIVVGSMFLVFSLYYAQTRRLLPVIVAHTLQDVLALAFYLHRHH